jgi:hypothetical protein
VAITAIAVALRFAALPGQPGGLFQDEAAEGDDALRLLRDSGFHPLFFDDDGGREPPFAYLVALVFRIGGASTGALRGTAAALGVLGVLAILLALRRFGWGVALAGAAWSAGALWLVATSRDGFRTVLVVPVGALTFWALARWADRPGRATATTAGAVAAAGLWTYQPLKLVPLLAALWLLWLRRSAPDTWSRLRAGLPVAIAAYAIVAAPMIAVAVIDPNGYFGRGAGVSVFGSGGVSDLPMHVLRTVGMFGFVGDPNARHNAGNLPLLSLPLALVAAAGIARAIRNRSDPASALLLIGVPVFLIPPLIAVEGDAPHFLRSLGLAPYLAGLIGLGVLEITDMTGRVRRLGCGLGARLIGTALCLAALTASTVVGATAYFGRSVADRYDAYSFGIVALAEVSAGPGTTVIIDDYRALVIRFVDRDNLPSIVPPGTRLIDVRGPVFAADRGDLDIALGPRAASAVAVAFDPAGRAVAWRVGP